VPQRPAGRELASGVLDDAEPLAEVSAADAEAELEKIAYRLLARRDRSRSEMQSALASHCAEATVVERVLERLQARGWLSEARMAEHFVGTRRARMSTSRMRQEMARRGLDAGVIAQSTTGLDEADLGVATTLWRKRFRSLPQDRKEREKQLRFLLQRGFSQAVALKVLRAVEDQAADESERSDEAST